MDQGRKSESTRNLAPEQAERISYMRENWTLFYERFEEWYEQVMDFVATDEAGQLVMLIGPTHVGKTTLMRFCDRALVEMARKQGLPVTGETYIRLPAPNRGGVDHGEMYWRLLEATQQPAELIEHTVEYGDIRSGALKPSSLPRKGRPPTHSALLRSIVNRINNGYHAAIFLDEAGEIPLLLKNAAVMQAAMTIKEIADLTRKSAFIAGGPEVAPLLWQTAQLTARIQPIWMAPLDPSSKADKGQFAAVLRAMANELGTPYIRVDVMTLANCSYMMTRLWGTVGLATKVTLRAVSASLRRTGEPLGWDELKDAVDREYQRLRIQMPIEQAMFASAMNPDLREQYWASASHMSVTPQNFHKKRPGAIVVPEIEPADAARVSSKSKRGKSGRGLSRPEVPRRRATKNLPGEGASSS